MEIFTSFSAYYLAMLIIILVCIPIVLLVKKTNGKFGKIFYGFVLFFSMQYILVMTVFITKPHPPFFSADEPQTNQPTQEINQQLREQFRYLKRVDVYLDEQNNSFSMFLISIMSVSPIILLTVLYGLTKKLDELENKVNELQEIK